MYSGDEYYGDEITSPVARPICTYEVREQSKFATTPEDRGILIGVSVSWAGAVAIRDKAIAAGWPAYISTRHN